MERPDNTDWTRRYWILLGVITLVRMFFASILPLSGDEAYYWDCSKHVDWTYFDQPPIAIWLIVPFRLILGDTFLATRMPAILASLGIGLCLPGLAGRLGGGHKEAFHAYLWMSAMPIFIIGSFYESTDIMMSAFYIAVTWAAVAIAQGERRAWWGFGIAIGLGFLSKFPAVIVLPALVPALMQKKVREDLKTAVPWLAALLAFALTGPIWIWGAKYEWANILFQLKGRHEVHSLSGKFIGEFIGANLLLATPFLFVAIVISWWKAWKRRDPGWNVVLVSAAIPFVFFGLFALRQRVGAHWAGAGLMLGVLVFALAAHERPRRVLAWSSGLFGGIISALVVIIVLFPDPVREMEWSYKGRPERFNTKALAEISGNREVALHAAAIRRPDEIVSSESYSLTHLMAFYTEGDFPVTLANVENGEHGLASLYWSTASELRGRDFLFVTKMRVSKASFEPHFESVEELDQFEIERGGEIVRSFRIFRARNLVDPVPVFTRVDR